MKLDDQNEFEQLWTSLKPSEKLEIKIAGKIIDCPHYFRSYLRAYKFIVLDNKSNLGIPLRIERLLNEFYTRAIRKGE